MDTNILVVKKSTLSVLNSNVDYSFLDREWNNCREKFLFHTLTKDGMEKEHLRINTRKTYQIALRKFFDGVYSDNGTVIWPIIKPWLVNRHVIDDWKKVMGLAGNKGSKLATSTINVYLAGLKMFFDYAQFNYELPYNPTFHQPLIDDGFLFYNATNNTEFVSLVALNGQNPFDTRVNNRGKVVRWGKTVFPTADELKRIFSTINTDSIVGMRDFALLMALYSTGCRASEILNLKWGHINQKDNGHYSFRFYGKSKKMDEVELQASVFQIICGYLDAADKLNVIKSDDYIFAPVFPNRIKRINPNATMPQKSKPITTSQANKIFKKYGKRAGVDLEKCHLHGLRHARANQTANDMKNNTGSIDIVELSRLLRHSNISTTRIYIDSVMNKKEDVYANDAILAVVPSGWKKRKKNKVSKEQMKLL